MSDEKPTKAELKDIHSQALKRADEAWAFEVDNVTKGREDQRFYVGGLDQWDAAAQKARGTNRPMLTVNRMPAFVRQLTGEIRRETPAIKVLPARGEASKDTADVFNGLIRNIEAQSDADACYAIAAENAAIAGQGAFRIVREYSSDDGFDQDLRIRPIRDPFAVLIDPMALLPDKSDMGYGFIFERMSKEAFKAKYPDAQADDMPMNAGTQSGFSWRTGESVRIAEYWARKPEKATLYLLHTGEVVDALPDGGVAAVKRERQVERQKVCSYIMSGKEILSGPHEWLGKYIPICVVAGEEITVDGATVRKGMVRDAKDPQKLLNYARTTEAESTALQPKAPFVLTVDQIKGHEALWNQAGTSNLPYLLFNVDRQATGMRPERSQPPVMSQGLAALSVSASQDLKDVTGIQDASLGATSNETSGRAILARQREGDTGTFLYQDNLRRAIAYGGRILVDTIPKVYDSERDVSVLGEDGSQEMVTLNQAVPDPERPGEFKLVNDLSVGEYAVVVSTGPSFLTKREEKREALIGLTQSMPVLSEVAADLIIGALDFPGGDEIVERLRPKMGIGEDGKPTEPKPDPVVVADAMLKGAQADKVKAEGEGVEVDTFGKVMEMQMMLAGIPQAMAGMQATLQQILAMNGQSGQPGGQAPPAAPPAQPGAMPASDFGGYGDPTDMADLEPLGLTNGESDMADLEPIEGAPV